MRVQFTSDDGETLITVALAKRDESNPFSSGSIGFYGGGRVSINSIDYQLSLSLVEPNTADEGRAKVAAQVAADKRAKREDRAATRR